MPERLKYLSDETLALLLKVIPISLASVFLSIGFKMKKEKITIFNGLLSIFAGIFFSYLAAPFVLEIENEKYHIVLISLVAISGDKIAEYIIYKLKIELILMALFDLIYERIKGKKQ